MLKTITLGAAGLLLTASLGSAQTSNWAEPDMNQDGRVTIAEWQEYFGDKERQFPPEADANRNAILETDESEQMFLSYDLDGDGELDADEFRQYEESVM